ncbi:TPA: hypothetical protein DCW61_03740 [Candidatus Uhrbacteria bacterium]|nr:hypothetical protein [Candidatus Uhrbacteria bacterium]
MDTMFFLEVIHPGQLLFALVVLLFGSAFTLSFLIGSKTEVVKPLIAVLFVILFLLLGTLAIEFSAAQTPSYTYGAFASLSEALSTHRWLLFQLPLVLTMSSLFILMVYQERIKEKHAFVYRGTVLFSIGISFASVVVIIFESML